MKTYLGLDLGSKTCGIAISSSGIIAETYDTLRFRENDYDEALSLVVQVIKQTNASVVVLGMPKHMNNDIGIRGKISESFKASLEQAYPVEVILWDERLSTRTAMQAMSKVSEKNKTKKAKKDELAAVVILQNYLNYKGVSLC
jgi:putative holliday junction resolvase